MRARLLQVTNILSEIHPPTLSLSRISRMTDLDKSTAFVSWSILAVKNVARRLLHLKSSPGLSLSLSLSLSRSLARSLSFPTALYLVCVNWWPIFCIDRLHVCVLMKPPFGRDVALRSYIDCCEQRRGGGGGTRQRARGPSGAICLQREQPIRNVPFTNTCPQ